MQKLAKDYENNLIMKAEAKTRVPEIMIKYVSWKPPPQNWINLYMDGSFLSDRMAAMCGENHEES